MRSRDNINPAGLPSELVKEDLGQEIVVLDRDTRKLYVLDDEGNPLPGWPRTIMNWAWSTPALGDIDGDGDLEIVVNDIGGYTYAFHHDGTEVGDGDNNAGTYPIRKTAYEYVPCELERVEPFQAGYPYPVRNMCGVSEQTTLQEGRPAD